MRTSTGARIASKDRHRRGIALAARAAGGPDRRSSPRSMRCLQLAPASRKRDHATSPRPVCAPARHGARAPAPPSGRPPATSAQAAPRPCQGPRPAWLPPPHGARSTKTRCQPATNGIDPHDHHRGREPQPDRFLRPGPRHLRRSRRDTAAAATQSPRLARPPGPPRFSSIQATWAGSRPRSGRKWWMPKPFSVSASFGPTPASSVRSSPLPALGAASAGGRTGPLAAHPTSQARPSGAAAFGCLRLHRLGFRSPPPSHRFGLGERAAFGASVLHRLGLRGSRLRSSSFTGFGLGSRRLGRLGLHRLSFGSRRLGASSFTGQPWEPPPSAPRPSPAQPWEPPPWRLGLHRLRLRGQPPSEPRPSRPPSDPLLPAACVTTAAGGKTPRIASIGPAIAMRQNIALNCDGAGHAQHHRRPERSVRRWFASCSE